MKGGWQFDPGSQGPLFIAVGCETAAYGDLLAKPLENMVTTKAPVAQGATAPGCKCLKENQFGLQHLKAFLGWVKILRKPRRLNVGMFTGERHRQSSIGRW